jgi:diadenylate cyclase
MPRRPRPSYHVMLRTTSKALNINPLSATAARQASGLWDGTPLLACTSVKMGCILNSMFEFISNFADRLDAYNWWIVCIELLLIGTVVHSILYFLRDTRGARLIRGTILFLIIAFTVIWLSGNKLIRVEFLFQRILLFTSLAIVVVFQPELRRALIRLGEARLFRIGQKRPSDMVEALVKSADYCSRNRIGALIAIERQVGLAGIVENGTSLDADVTSELLNTIFWPGSALHDMGVVIRNGRLAAAGVQFPLDEGCDLPTELGARHRAALGLSQDTDAFIIVVSEETGTISVAQRGKLDRGLTPDDLRRRLYQELDLESRESQDHSILA